MLFDAHERAWETLPHAKNAIVTVIIGQDYLKVWKTLCEANWRAYADAHGYDIFVISDYIDKSDASRARSPAWQKLLILEQPWSQRYERIVWLDADIVISAAAIDILETATPAEKVGICAVGAQMSPAEKHIYCEHVFTKTIRPQDADEVWNAHVAGQYRGSGVRGAGGPMLSTGVMLLSPRIIRRCSPTSINASKSQASMSRPTSRGRCSTQTSTTLSRRVSTGVCMRCCW